MLDKKFDPSKFEKDIFSFWEENNFFYSQSKTDKLYTIVLPPPNVTGHLHIGHAWNVSIQDALIRYKKINGFNVKWISGMDHAGIATQTKYESYLKSNNIDKNKFTREELNKKIYDWSRDNANKIRSQWKKMGLMLDYNNEFFTLDDNINEIVNDLFIKMYNDGLIHRDYRLVNWDVKLKTAVSNIEVIKKDVKNNLYYIKYNIENSQDNLLVATTRPETMFADTCLVVNPKDERFKKYIGLNVINPANNKLIPIIADNYIDMEYGTGVMKCTPAHDFNDYEIGKKYKQSFESCMNLDGTMNSLAKEFQGLDRLECRKKLVEKLKKESKILKVEEQESAIGFSERTGEVIEPLLSLQWFIKMKDLANKAIQNQDTNDAIKFFSKRFERDLLRWLVNIDDWCISRQLTWGHRIPIWYDINGNMIASVNKPNKEGEWKQDDDVFDTWFSSGTWPFSTSGFTFKNNDTSNIPTDVLVTAYDILFFWVARMIMISLYATKKIPFKDVVIHGLIRDEQNRKMSKSLGNGVDPMEIIDEYGCDALRLFLLSSSTPGEDLIFSKQKIQESMFFLNKIWNISIFISSRTSSSTLDKNKEIDEWIINKYNLMKKEYDTNFEKYNFNVAIKSFIKFIRDDFSSTYIELNKNRTDDRFINISKSILKNILLLLHPISPFISEMIYKNIFNIKESIILESFDELVYNNKSFDFIDISLEVLEFIRQFKFDNSIKRIDELPISITFKKDVNNELIKVISEITQYENVKITEVKAGNINNNSNIKIFNDFIISIVASDSINQNSTDKLIKEKEKLIFEVNRSSNMLSNDNFVKKAPKKLIDEEESKLRKNKARLEEIDKILNKL